MKNQDDLNSIFPIEKLQKRLEYLKSLTPEERNKEIERCYREASWLYFFQEASNRNTLADFKINFAVMPANQFLPETKDNEAIVIAFEPKKGFQSAKYYNGSKTWQSLITGETITVTEWLRPLGNIEG